jgi:ribose transport system permease protein
MEKGEERGTIAESSTRERQAADVSARPARWRTLARADYVGMLLALVVLMGIFATRSENFLTVSNFRTLANQIPSLIVISVGMTFVIVTAGIDLSVGSVMALASAIIGVAMYDWKWPLGLSVPLGLAAGAACGLLVGVVTVGWALPSFIVTLGMLEAARGAAYLVTGSQTKYIGEAIAGLTEPIGKVGLSLSFFAAVIVAVIGQFMLSRTVFGRYMVAIGTNEEAVRLSGIDPRPTRVAVFALSGLLAALAGVFNCSRLSTADPNAGIGWELSAIAAVVIGGTSLMGGRGSVVNTVFGVLIIAVLENGLSLLDATEPVKRLITGLVIVAAVILDAYRRNRAARRAGA